MSLRERKAERRRQEILHAAARAFKKNGFHATTMEDIAGELLMTQGSLYYYFKSKEEILYACHLHSLNRLTELLDRVEAAEASQASKIRTLIEKPIQMGIDELHGSAMALEFGALSGDYQRELIELRDRYETGLRQLIRSGIESGEFVPVNPRLTGFAILGSINWITRWFDPDGPLPPETVARHFSDLFLRALGVDPAAVPSLPDNDENSQN